jgi:LPS export ABC transporter protein LptC
MKEILVNFFSSPRLTSRILILLGIIVFAFFIFRKEEDETTEEIVLFESNEEGVQVESFGVEYLFSDSARVSAQLIAGHVQEKETGEGAATQTIHYLDQGVEVYFLNAYGQTTSQITSESGEYNRKAGLAELKGSVVLINKKGEKLETEQLFWDEKKDSVFTNKFVRIETPDRVITGRKGLRANTEFTSWTIIQSQGEVEVKDE